MGFAVVAVIFGLLWSGSFSLTVNTTVREQQPQLFVTGKRSITAADTVLQNEPITTTVLLLQQKLFLFLMEAVLLLENQLC